MNHRRCRPGLLIAIASPIEWQACRLKEVGYWAPLTVTPGVEAVLTGIGKASAAGGVARVLDPARHTIVVSIGIGGVLPNSDRRIGEALVADRSIFADEGIETPEGYQTCSQMGFPSFETGDALMGDRALIDRLVAAGMGCGPIATVSTCSGTDERAQEIARRTGAEVEAMEGAAVALAAHRCGVRFAELRVISNTAGNRDAQVWDLPLALPRLGSAFELLCRLVDVPDVG